MTKESENSWSRNFEESPDYKEIKEEIDPLITGLIIMGGENIRFKQFKKSLTEWNIRYVKAIKTIDVVQYMQKLQISLMGKEKNEDNRRLLTVIGLFRYLGLIESIGAQFVDLLVLLLVANGHEFHVEREHEVPRIVHATTLRDLRNAFLGPKVRFLERCGLKKTSKLIDVDLRNSIAHLDFEIDESGKVSARSQGESKKEINVLQKIDEFNRRFLMLFFMFNEIQDHVLSAPTDKKLKVTHIKKREVMQK
ncbi:MAG: hypothetical protein OEY24_06005 [Candidatus Bathyarchaeota archaeon]|nr:hypothetical protein [Candidatus Bathyarchaeota archaeon]MDH5495240.1 hypothetical protein [Candidatus Bathyarchaeota archaeon]